MAVLFQIRLEMTLLPKFISGESRLRDVERRTGMNV